MNTKQTFLLEVSWAIPENVLKKCYYHSNYMQTFKNKNHCCSSQIFKHKQTQTLWCLTWYPYGTKKSRGKYNDKISIMALTLINKALNVKTIKVKNRKIECL